MEASTGTQQRLDTLLRDFEELRHRLVGYPCNQSFDYSALLPFLSYCANNVGDPFHDSNFRSNTHEFEREVIGLFADLMHLPRDQAWGYVTSGGTEGNMYGLYIGREMFPDGVVYFSQDTHYSVVKILRVLKARNIMIKSQDNGEIDYDDLHETIRINRDVPVIFMANIGTTMKGAVDDVSRVRAILDDLAVTDSYIHADAALSGMVLPFVDEPQPYGFDAGFDSVAISGHKMIGSPLPCGIALTRGDYVSRIARSIEYVGVLDTTLTGSRNALTPLMMWYALRQHGLDGFREIVAECLAVAGYAVARFNDSGIPAWRNRNSVTVVFPKPSADVVRRWQLAPYEGICPPHNDASRDPRDRRCGCRRLSGVITGTEDGRMNRIIVMARNEVGVIADISRTLADEGINIETISAEALDEKGIITLTTEAYDDALRALTDAGFKTVSDDALILRLPDEPGALAKVAERFKHAGVNIQSLHIVERKAGHTIVALSADDRAKAETLVDKTTVV